MPLPILSHPPQPSNDDLLRLYHKCELHWSRQLVEQETTLDVGTALANATLPNVWDANHIAEASLPPGVSPADAVTQVNQHFASAGTRCFRWVMNPSAPSTQTAPLFEHLISIGYKHGHYDVLYLAHQPTSAIQEIGHLTIVPARAAFRHARRLAEESAGAWKTPSLADASMLHLEDPATDALLALRDGSPLGLAAVMAVGEIGYVGDLFVTGSARRQGIGRTLMSRAIEICARSLFKHVFVGVDADNDVARRLYEQFGFMRIGTFDYYLAPGATPIHARP
jgi:ribosomal protein S18 acetylase RimI-like enzyme